MYCKYTYSSCGSNTGCVRDAFSIPLDIYNACTLNASKNFRGDLYSPKWGRRLASIHVLHHFYTATTFAQHQFSMLLSVETHKNHGVLSTNCKWWDVSPSYLLCSSNHSISNRPRAFEKVKSPWSDKYMHALIQVENILNICCKLWLDKQQ